jgi:hypothetical protein
MKKRELAFWVSSTLVAFSGAGVQADDAVSNASSWGFSCESAIENARDEACGTCVNKGQHCGDTMYSSCDDGWIYDTATVGIECNDS